jgi:hypothetical protein
VFFLCLLVSGRNEKYIKEKKAASGSKLSRNFAAEIRKKDNNMKFTTLLTIIIVGYVIYYAYQIIHDLFFTKGVLSDELHIEEEVDITGEVEKYQPVKVSREDIPLTKTNTEKDSTQDDGLTQMCGGYTIDELHHALCLEQENPGSTALKDVMKLYE